MDDLDGWKNGPTGQKDAKKIIKKKKKKKHKLYQGESIANGSLEFSHVGCRPGYNKKTICVFTIYT